MVTITFNQYSLIYLYNSQKYYVADFAVCRGLPKYAHMKWNRRHVTLLSMFLTHAYSCFHFCLNYLCTLHYIVFFYLVTYLYFFHHCLFVWLKITHSAQPCHVIWTEANCYETVIVHTQLFTLAELATYLKLKLSKRIMNLLEKLKKMLASQEACIPTMKVEDFLRNRKTWHLH